MGPERQVTYRHGPMLTKLCLLVPLVVCVAVALPEAGCGSSQITLADDGGAVTPDGTPAEADATPPPPPPPDAAPGTPDAALPDKHVVPIYIAASDESDADIATHVATYNAIMGGIRAWYTEHLPGDPVTFYSEPVRVMRGHHTRAEWDDYGAHGFEYPDGHRTEEGGGCSMYYGAEWELRDGGLLAAAGLPPLGSGTFVYYAINGGGLNGSCGAGGYLGASVLQLLTLAAVNCPEGRRVGNASDCSQTGAVAHELGHGFGLPHGSDRPACTDGPTLMDVWWQYDDGARLCVEDRSDLRSSGYFFPL
jgi:hypothetical protein